MWNSVEFEWVGSGLVYGDGCGHGCCPLAVGATAAAALHAANKGVTRPPAVNRAFIAAAHYSGYAECHAKALPLLGPDVASKKYEKVTYDRRPGHVCAAHRNEELELAVKPVRTLGPKGTDRQAEK